METLLQICHGTPVPRTEVLSTPCSHGSRPEMRTVRWQKAYRAVKGGAEGLRLSLGL